MQVITGKFRGRKLISPDSARPTLQRIKISLFSMIQGYIEEGIKVLDLFAGSGALGLECLSRGASKVIFSDADKGAVKCIKQNLKNIDEKLYSILESDYLTVLKKLQGKEKFDIIFLDPPYEGELVISASEIIERYDLLQVGGILVVETDSSKKLDFNFKSLSLVKERIYGLTRILVFKKN